MKEQKNVRKRMAIVVTFLFLISFFITHTVSSQAKEKTDAGARYDSFSEEEYLDRVREVLKEEGYSNCGLTLTFAREAGGERDYTLMVHHRRFGHLEPERREEILEEVSRIPFGTKGCALHLIGE